MFSIVVCDMAKSPYILESRVVENFGQNLWKFFNREHKI
jgi:hypothetical protein